MAKYNINTKRGFTIIEVVLVLAIAGLIFLMVFIALPNMQRSQRDTQRRQDYANLSATMTNYITNNNGSLPKVGKLDPSKYINSNGQDPDGYVYALNVVEFGSTAATNEAAVEAVTKGNTDTANTAYGTVTSTSGKSHYVYVATHAKCEAGKPVYDESSRAFAVYGYLETGSGTFCQ